MIMSVTGVIVPGYGIASETATKSQTLVSNVYLDKREIVVDKTVWRQFPYFIQAGVKGIESMHPGTINVDISPQQFSVLSPNYEVACEWIPGIRETFRLTSIGVLFNRKRYDGYIYFPCISEQHVARNHMVEVITELIPDVMYGKEITLYLNDESIRVIDQRNRNEATEVAS